MKVTEKTVLFVTFSFLIISISYMISVIIEGYRPNVFKSFFIIFMFFISVMSIRRSVRKQKRINIIRMELYHAFFFLLIPIFYVLKEGINKMNISDKFLIASSLVIGVISIINSIRDRKHKEG